MILKAQCFVILYITAAATTVSFGQLGCLQPDKQPPKWEAGIFQHDSAYHQQEDKAYYKKMVSHLSCDLEQQKVAAVTHMLGEGSKLLQSYRVVEDWSQNISWTIRGKKCTKRPLTQNDSVIASCLPSDGEEVQNNRSYGGMSSSTWVSQHNDTTSRVTFSDGSCMLLTCSVLITDTNNQGLTDWQLKVYNFQNQTLGIKDPSVFSLPDSCKPHLTSIPPLR